MKFVSQRVEVEEGSSPRRPLSFVWEGKRYAVDDVIASWQDWGFSAGTKSKNWRSRRHRNCFHVRTTDGSEFELYLDRGPHGSGDEWILHLKLK